ncbi:AAA-like domain protein [Phycisphaerae bacterium RAS1]|nr:AAA-like domain protein [Phycisphaerae bacterium RAS1]
MSSQKNSKPLDLTGIQLFVEQTPGPAFGALAPIGTTTRPPIELLRPVEPITFDQIWREIPTAMWWEILERKRVRELCPGDATPEWERYQQLRRRSPAPRGSEVFIGLERRVEQDSAPTQRPIFAPREVFKHHAYILGLPGTGKTAQALATLLLQLAEAYTDKEGRFEPHPPLLIIDLKEGGDNYLRTIAAQIAASREQKTLRFFSNDPDFESLKFDPLYCLRSIRYPLKKAETILKALSLIYKEGYGSDFFTAEQHTQLLKTLYQDQPETLAEMIKYIDAATRGNKKNKDARGLYSALAPLQYSFHLDERDDRSGSEFIDLERFYENGEVLYVHLNSRSQSIDAKVIGKLIIFALMETAAERKKQGNSRQAFVAIDEFQRLAAQNIVEVLEDSRSLGVGFVLAHQSPESLRTRETDLYRMIADLCSYKQFLSLTSSNIVEQLQLVSGRRIERRQGESEGTTEGTSKSHGSSFGESSTSGTSKAKTYGWFVNSSTTDGVTHSSGRNSSNSTTNSTNEGKSNTKSWKEEAVAGLTPEAIAAVNGTPLLSLIHVHSTDERSATPLGGIPTLVQGLYPFHAEEARRRGEARWEMKTVPTDDFIEKGRARLPRGAISEIRGKRPKQSDADRKSAKAPPGKENGEDQRLDKKLRDSIRDVGRKLSDQILPEPRTVHSLSKNFGTVPEIIALASEFGVTVKDDNDVVPARVVREIQRRRRAQVNEQTEKDNGPPQGPVV